MIDPENETIMRNQIAIMEALEELVLKYKAGSYSDVLNNRIQATYTMLERGYE